MVLSCLVVELFVEQERSFVAFFRFERGVFQNDDGKQSEQSRTIQRMFNDNLSSSVQLTNIELWFVMRQIIYRKREIEVPCEIVLIGTRPYQKYIFYLFFSSIIKINNSHSFDKENKLFSLITL